MRKDTDEARDAITQQRCRLAREESSRGQIKRRQNGILSVDAGNRGPPLHLLGAFGQAKHNECHVPCHQHSAESSAEPAKVPKILGGLVLQGT